MSLNTIALELVPPNTETRSGAGAGGCGQGAAVLRRSRPRGPDPARDDPRNDRRGRRPAHRDEAEDGRAGLLVDHQARAGRHERAVHPGHRVHGRADSAPAADRPERRGIRRHRLRRRAAHDERRRRLRRGADRCAVHLRRPGTQPRRDPDPDPRRRAGPVQLQVRPGCDLRDDPAAVLGRDRRLPRASSLRPPITGPRSCCRSASYRRSKPRSG